MTGTLDLVARAGDHLADLDNPAALELAAKLVIDICLDHPGAQLAAASPAAERVVGAALIMDSTLTAAARSCAVLIDINFASGTQIARASRSLRRSGADTVVGVVLHSLVSPPAPGACGLDELLVIHQEADLPVRLEVSRLSTMTGL